MIQNVETHVKDGMSIISYRDLTVSFYNTLSGGYGEAYFNFPLTVADVIRLNNLKVVEVFYYSSSDEQSTFTYQALQFYDTSLFRDLLSEFLLFKSTREFESGFHNPIKKKNHEQTNH